MILFASNNNGKVIEIKKILNNYDIVSLRDLGLKIDVVEDANTFVGNATKKAKEILNLNVCNRVIADDSGLEIDFLNGFPSVKTARFLGKNKTPRERNLFILEKLKGVPREKRTCSAVCALVYVDSLNNEIAVEGRLYGYISEKIVEGNSFGFDEIFELENGVVVSQLTLEEKNKISARTNACLKLLKKLEESNIKID